MLLPYEDYDKKIFKEIYIETLALLPDRDDGINLMIVKNYSLSLPVNRPPFILILQVMLRLQANHRREQRLRKIDLLPLR